MDAGADLGGYAELRGSWAFGVDGTEWALVERLRPRIEVAPAERVTVEVVPEVGFAQGRDTAFEAASMLLASPAGTLLDAAGCAYTRPARYDTVADYAAIERLHVDLNLPAVDLSIGRQAIAWGSGLAFHPTDLYAEVVLTEPWRERRGVNAIKATVPVGRHSVTALLAVDDDLSSLHTSHPSLPGSAALKGTLNVGGMDLSAVGYASHAPGEDAADGRAAGTWDGFVGADLRGTFGVGWWVEGGWHTSEAAPEVVAGLDASFPVLQLLYVAAEGRWDGTGSAPDDIDPMARVRPTADPGALGFDCAFLAAPSSTSTSGRVRVTEGRAYGDLVVRLGVTEDVSLAGVIVANLEDGSANLVPSLAWALGARSALNLGAQVPLGAHGELNPDPADLTLALGPQTVDLSGLLPSASAQAWLRTSF